MRRVADTAGRTAQPGGRRYPGPARRARHGAVCEPSATVLCVVVVGLAVIAVTDGAPVTAAVVTSATLPAAVVDLRVRRLPDVHLLRASLAGGAAAVVERIVGSRLDDIDLLGVAAGMVAVAGPLLVLHLASPPSMGFGDVKLAIVLGAGLGVVDPVAGLVALAGAGALGALIGVVGRRRTIPFGPALVVGAAASMVVTPWVVAS